MKKLLALLLALTMVFGLFACGGKDPGVDQPETTEAPGTNTTSTVTAICGNGWIAMYGRQKGAFGSLHPTIKRCSAFRMEIRSEWFSPPEKRKITPAAMWTRPIWRLAEIFTISVSSQNG